MIKPFIKAIARKVLLKEAKPTLQTAEFFQKAGKNFLCERSFYFGRRRLRATSLAMEAAPGTTEMILNVLSRYPMKGASILDFGCGQHKSAYLRNFEFNVHSCDMLTMDIPNFVKIDPTAAVLPFADKQFDVVVASEVLEHVESPWVVLQELVRISKQAVVISTPNTMSLKSRKVFSKTGYLHWFAPENFAYHISPIFAWQVELFCKNHHAYLAETLGNHQAFKLKTKANVLDLAESLVFVILPKE